MEPTWLKSFCIFCNCEGIDDGTNFFNLKTVWKKDPNGYLAHQAKHFPFLTIDPGINKK